MSGELLRAYLVAQKCRREHADVLRAAPHPELTEVLHRLGTLASPGCWQGKGGPSVADREKEAGSRHWQRAVPHPSQGVGVEG